MDEIFWGECEPEFLFEEFITLYDRDPGDPRLAALEKALNDAKYKVGIRYISEDEENLDTTAFLEEIYLLDPSGIQIESKIFEIPHQHQLHAPPEIKDFPKIIKELGVVW